MLEQDQRKNARSVRIIWSLLIASLLIAALDQSLSILLLREFALMFQYFWVYSIALFLVNPVILFAVIYHMGRNVDIGKFYVPVGISLFVGGLVGGSVTYFLLPVLQGGQWGGGVFPDILTLVGTVIAFTIIVLEFGLSTLFPGFVAVVIANFRRNRSIPPQARIEQQKTSTASFDLS